METQFSGTNNQITEIRDGGGTLLRALTYATGGELTEDNRGTGNDYVYGYSNRTRMASATQSGTGVGTYGVDAFDARVTRQTTGSGAIDHDYIFDADGHLLAEHDATTGDVMREYIWIDDVPVAMVDQSSGTEQIYFIHTGQTGEPLMMTDSTKAPVWDDYLDPYGTATPLGTDTVSLDLRYPGQWLQPETGNLAQNWFRDYDASLGRYAEADPLGFEAGQNLYGYAGANPLVQIDPDGQQAALSWCFGGPGGCAAGIALTGITVWMASPAGKRETRQVTKAILATGQNCPNNDFCHNRWETEYTACFQWKTLGMRWVNACQTRATDRRNLCIANGGHPNPDEPPEWTPFRDYPRK